MKQRWPNLLAIMPLTFVAVALTGCPPNVGGPNSTSTCLGCHDGRTATNITGFLSSSHSFLSCTQCHGDGTAHVQSGGAVALISNPARLPFDQSYASCVTCHSDIVDAFLQSGHATAKAASCENCHNPHVSGGLALPVQNNAMCIECHGTQFPTEMLLTAHTNHPVDPAGTGASRCINCHMLPTARENQADVPLDHAMMIVEPMVSANSPPPAPINSCGGVTGCHDGSVPGAPVFDIDNPQQMEFVQSIFDVWFPEE